MQGKTYPVENEFSKPAFPHCHSKHMDFNLDLLRHHPAEFVMLWLKNENSIKWKIRGRQNQFILFTSTPG